MPVSDLADPRARPPGTCAEDSVHAQALHAIEAATAAEADRYDAQARRNLEVVVAAGDGMTLAKVLEEAPSPEIARHLRRLLADIERGEPASAGELRTTLFAIPVVLVAALDAGAAQATLDAILPDAPALTAILRDARAFGGCETFALSPALVATDAIDLCALPALLARRPLAPHDEEFGSAALDLPPASIGVEPGLERVHLRFIPGAILTPPHADPFASSTIGGWGIAFASAIAKALAAPGVSLLALPRPPQRLVAAVQSGRAAQREVSAQLFASNAIRKLRASFGEPTAIVSAHAAPEAAGGGELRLSLSSPFAVEAAEGFRCPLYPYETVQEVGGMLEALLRDCRVSDVRFMPGIHGDVDPLTGGPRFFKDGAETDAPLH
jgi:hypothetical protein